MKLLFRREGDKRSQESVFGQGGHDTEPQRCWYTNPLEAAAAVGLDMCFFLTVLEAQDGKLQIFCRFLVAGWEALEALGCLFQALRSILDENWGWKADSISSGMSLLPANQHLPGRLASDTIGILSI